MCILEKLYRYSLKRKSEINKGYSLRDYIFLQKRKAYDFSKGSCTNIGELEPYTRIFYIYKINKLYNTIGSINLKRKNKHKKILSLKEKHFEESYTQTPII